MSECPAASGLRSAGRRLGRSSTVWAISLAAAWAEDRVLLCSGGWVDGQVVSQDAGTVHLLVDGMPVSLARSRVEAVLSGGAERAPAPTEGTRLPHQETGWSLDLGLAVGWGRGRIDGSGSMLTTATGAVQPVATGIGLDGVGAIPGASLRCCWSSSGGGMLWGAQIAAGRTQDDAATTDFRQIEALAGWTVGAAWRWHGALLAGWNLAQSDRRLVLANALGATVTTLGNRADLAGPVAAVETGLTWCAGGRRLGIICGLQTDRWSGNATWTSADGAYRGEEDLSGRMTALYAGLTCGWGW